MNRQQLAQQVEMLAYHNQTVTSAETDINPIRNMFSAGPLGAKPTLHKGCTVCQRELYSSCVL